MKINEQRARRAITIMGALHDPDAEKVIQEVASRDWRWWQVLWAMLRSPREVWLGFVDGLRGNQS